MLALGEDDITMKLDTQGARWGGYTQQDRSKKENLVSFDTTRHSDSSNPYYAEARSLLESTRANKMSESCADGVALDLCRRAIAAGITLSIKMCSEVLSHASKLLEDENKLGGCDTSCS